MIVHCSVIFIQFQNPLNQSTFAIEVVSGKHFGAIGVTVYPVG